MTAVLMVLVLGQTMEVKPYPTYEACEHERELVFEPIKTSSTKYWCIEVAR